MYALVDCNNFYVSCERLFQPALKRKPIVVLSNNDGCVIARSEEAKKLGIVMGTPAYQYKHMFDAAGVYVFSSNYTLYGDISDRVMKTLTAFVPAIEVYSIDEAFLGLEGFDKEGLADLALKIRRTIDRNIGIKVTVGVAPTKTLAKMANRFAKHHLRERGVFYPGDPANYDSMLSATKVEDIWGIGKQHSLLLRQHGFITAKDLLSAPADWMQKNFSIVGLRMLNELKGIVSTPLEEAIAGKQNICTSRSFGRMTNDFDIIKEAASNYAANCAEKLRQQDSVCRSVQVFITTNPHKPSDRQYSSAVTLNCSVPTNKTNEIIGYALKALKMIFRNGYQYMKCGVIVMDIIPDESIQLNLFSGQPSVQANRVMKAIDQVNNSMGKNTIKFAVQRFDQRYKLKAERLSKKYTTDINDILKVKI